jgi:hypothetical protein
VNSPQEIGLIPEGVIGHLEMEQPRFQFAAVRDALLKQQTNNAGQASNQKLVPDSSSTGHQEDSSIEGKGIIINQEEYQAQWKPLSPKSWLTQFISPFLANRDDTSCRDN